MAILVTVLFWSIGNLIVRDSPLTGPQVAFWRYLLAAIIYAAVHRATVGPLRWADMKTAAPAAVAIALEIAAFFVAIKLTSVANVTVIGALMPLLLFGVATRRFAERIPLGVWVATGLALLGVAAVVFGATDGARFEPKGDVFAVVALLFFAAYFIFAKVARETISSFTLQTHSMLIGAPVLLMVTTIDSGGLGVPAGREWLHVIGLIIFPSTGHLLMNWAHAHVSLTLASLMTLGVPVLSILGAWLLFDETVNAVQAAGITLVLVVLSWAIVQTNRIRPDVDVLAGNNDGP